MPQLSHSAPPPVDDLVVFRDRETLLEHLRGRTEPEPVLGLRELQHDVDKELAVLRLLLDRLTAEGGTVGEVTAAQHQVTVIHGLLESACEPPVRRLVDVAELAADIASGVTAVHPGRVHLRTSGPAVVVGDAVLLRRALVNLVDNARMAAPHGVVRLQVHGAPGATSVEVEDDGSGPAAAVGGHGLGLHIVRAVAELHGGVASVDTSPLGGRRVLLVLPRAGAA